MERVEDQYRVETSEAVRPALAALDAATTALLLVDMQNAFVHPEGTIGVSGVDMGPIEATVEPCRRLIEASDAVGVPVLWTMQEHFRDDATRRRKRLGSHTAKRKRLAAEIGTWDAEIVAPLAPYAGDPAFVIHKHRFGAFYATRLEKVLDMLGVDTLLVGGVSANACIETTLREAYMRDYDVVAVTDAIAAVRPDWGEVALSVWDHYLCELAPSDEVIAWLESSSRPKVERIAQLRLRARDLRAAERFYVDLLGLTVERREQAPDGGAVVTLAEGIALCDGREPGGAPGLEALALRVRGAGAIAARLETAGIPVERATGADGEERVRALDPDGNRIELIGRQAEGNA